MKKEAIFKLIRNILFFILLIVATYWYIFREQDMNELLLVIKSADSRYIFLGICAMFLFYLVESYNIQCLLKLFGNKVSIFSALKYTFIGFFFSAITPAATGGQPVEVYYMTKDNVSGPKSTMALLIQLCGFQISTLSLGIICAIIKPDILSSGLLWLFIVGVIINGFALAFMLICTFSHRLTQKIVNAIIFLLTFFKVKNAQAKKESLEKSFAKYSDSSTFIKEHKFEFVKAIGRVFIQICVYYTIPYFVYRAMGLDEYNVLQMLMMQSVLYTTVSGLPLPGAVGVSETVFLSIFKPAFGEELIGGSMLLSRGITFYLFVLVSLVVVVANKLRTKDINGEIDEQINEIDAKYGIA
jgi:uncharacterized protein (TIRG00374 family)